MKFDRKIRLDRIGSATIPARVGKIVEVSARSLVCEEGAVIACRALGDNKIYGNIELPSGRQAKVVKGNLIAGVLGARQALHGYMGSVPETLEAGDVINLLNIGGVLGVCTHPNKDLGPPIEVEVLGAVIRGGEPLNIKNFALDPVDTLGDGAPIVIIMGTCMNSGKTYAAAEIIRLLSHAGVKIAAGKISGVAAQRDLLQMLDNGAIETKSFVDCGLPSTVNCDDLASVSRSVIHALDETPADLILLEIGDGIIGGYNVESILQDEQIRARVAARVLCANDLVGAWGGIRYLEERNHIPDIVSGPVTDNAVGTTYIDGKLGLQSANARIDAIRLAQLVADTAKLDVTVAD